MVSLGDTAISLHILQPPLTGGGGGPGKGQIWTQERKSEFWNLGGGVGVLESQNPKWQVLPKFQFSGGGEGACSGKSKPKVPSSA